MSTSYKPAGSDGNVNRPFASDTVDATRVAPWERVTVAPDTARPVCWSTTSPPIAVPATAVVCAATGSVAQGPAARNSVSDIVASGRSETRRGELLGKPENGV